MTTQLLAPDSTAALSSVVNVDDGKIITIFLTSGNGSAVPAGAELRIQLQRAGGDWADVRVMRAPQDVSVEIRGPVALRVQRRGPGIAVPPLGAEYNISSAVGAGGGGGGGAVTIADGASATLGARADAPAASDTATASLMAFMKRLVGKIPGFGAAASAAALPVVLASDDAQIGTKTNAATALPAGGAGLIGWLSNIWVAITSLLNVNTLRAPLLARQVLVTSVANPQQLTASTARVSLCARGCDVRYGFAAATFNVANTAANTGAGTNAHFLAQGARIEVPAGAWISVIADSLSASQTGQLEVTELA